MQRCRTACCGPGYCHHQLQVLHWIHIYRRWVSFAPRYTPECAMWSQRLLFIFLYCLQKHCADCRGDSHRLHLHSVLWCAAGTSPGKRTTSCSALMSAIQIHRAVCTWRSQCVCSGILVGCGMQKIAALSNLVAYYCIALPVGAALMFAAHLKILGNGLQHSIPLLRCSWIWASDQTNQCWTQTLALYQHAFGTESQQLVLQKAERDVRVLPARREHLLMIEEHKSA